MKKRAHHVIWSNYDLNVEDWQDFLEANCLLDEDEYDQYNAIAEMNNEYLYDERIAFKDIDKEIPFGCGVIAIADVGRWDGRIRGYREYNSLDEILYTDCDYAEWYCDEYHLRGRMSHHDGNNYATYYLFVGEGYSGDKFLEDLREGNFISESRWKKNTRSLRPYIAKYYGW